MKQRTVRQGKKRAKRAAKAPARPARSAEEERVEVTGLAAHLLSHPESGPRLTGGDVDADWETAAAVGDEAVGGSVATPDQDVVDEIGEALGVAQEPDDEVRTSEEILRERDRHRWTLEREAEKEGEV